jgi:PRC-barrel domain
MNFCSGPLPPGRMLPETGYFYPCPISRPSLLSRIVSVSLFHIALCGRIAERGVTCSNLSVGRRSVIQPRLGGLVMLKHSVVVVAAATLLLASAFAQTQDSEAPNPSAQTPAPPTKDAVKSEASESARPGFVAEQGKDQWLTSKNLIGASVLGPSNEKVGSINDLLVDRDGTIIAAVVGVGGFLGIGAKNVAVPFKSLELSRSRDNEDRIAMRFSKDELKQASDFKPLAPTPPAGPAGPPSAAPRTPGSPVMPSPRTQ